MGHVHHQHRAHLVRDLPHLGEIDPTWIGGVAGHQDEGLELTGLLPQGGIVEQSGPRVGAVAALIEHLARDVVPEAVGQVPARVQAHAHHPLVAECLP